MGRGSNRCERTLECFCGEFRPQILRDLFKSSILTAGCRQEASGISFEFFHANSSSFAPGKRASSLYIDTVRDLKKDLIIHILANLRTICDYGNLEILEQGSRSNT